MIIDDVTVYPYPEKGQSMESLSETRPVARKDYECMASTELFGNYCYPGDFTAEEALLLRDSFESGGKIKKGSVYINQRNKMDEIYTFKCRPEVLDIYFKYGCDEE